jgi:hypothetical protein
VTFGNRTLAIILNAVCFMSLMGTSLSASALEAADTTTSASAEKSKQTVSADYKGMVGLGLIGAELGFVVPTVCGLRETWSLIIFPIVGAGGGAAAGYFLLEKGDGHPTAAVSVLVAGMALVIPAAVITVWATSYRPSDEPTTVPSAFSVKVNARRANAQQMARAAGSGLVRWSPDGVFLGAPAITPIVTGATTTDKGFVLQPRSELRVALVSGKF